MKITIQKKLTLKQKFLNRFKYNRDFYKEELVIDFDEPTLWLQTKREDLFITFETRETIHQE